VKCGALHGDMDQSSRQAALTAFKQGRIHVLIATDVAARGLDVPTVRTVVSLYPPTSIESHVHRIGRTGRAGQKDGRAFTLVSPDTSGKFLADLVRSLQEACQPVGSALHRLARRGGKQGYGGGVGGRGGAGGGGRGKRAVGGRGVGFLSDTDVFMREYDDRKAAEATVATAVAAGTIPPPPPPPPPGTGAGIGTGPGSGGELRAAGAWFSLRLAHTLEPHVHNPKPRSQNPKTLESTPWPQIQNLKSFTLNSKPLTPKPYTTPRSWSLNARSQTPNPEPYTLKSKT
jgi:hypothetical protein